MKFVEQTDQLIKESQCVIIDVSLINIHFNSYPSKKEIRILKIRTLLKSHSIKNRGSLNEITKSIMKLKSIDIHL